MHTQDELTAAAQAERGICLSCGEMQAFIQYRMPFAPCRSCGHWHVLHAKAALRVLALVREPLARVGRVIEAPNDPPTYGKPLT